MKNKNTSISVSKDIVWPVLAGQLFLMADILVFSIDVKSGIILACFVLIFFLFSVIYYPYYKKKMTQETMDFLFEQIRVQNHLIKELPLPYVLIGGDGDIMWYNQAFEKILDGKNISKLQQMFPELDKNLLPSEMNHAVSHVKRESREKDQDKTCFYKIEFVRIQMDSLIDEETESKSKQWLRDQSMIAAYIFDQTMLKMYMEQNENQRMVVGLIYIDNYEELLDNVDEVKQSMLLALTDKKINKFIQNISGIVKKTEKDKYLIIFQQKYLEKVKAGKFHILEEVKSINLGSSGNMTLSISLGINGQSYQENYEAACTAMDLALGRGGDQAVIKDGEDISYYGENAAVVEKNTRVKARVKAHALRELLESKENVVIMSHKIPDPDAMGAAVGLYRLGLSLGRKAHIVMNEVTISVRPIMVELLSGEEYDEDMFISSDTAREITDDNTLLIVVDVNHASYTECEDLLEQTNTIVILDHHRKGKETIKYPVLSYIEP